MRRRASRAGLGTVKSARFRQPRQNLARRLADEEPGTLRPTREIRHEVEPRAPVKSDNTLMPPSFDALFSQLSGHHYIDGHPRSARGERSSNIIDPATEQVIGHLTDATAAEVDEAVRIADAAQKRWHKINYHRRAE